MATVPQSRSRSSIAPTASGRNPGVRNAVDKTDDDSTSGTLARGLAILEFVSAEGAANVPDIARALGISRSATYRLVSQLRDRSFLAETAGGGFRLGGGAVRLGLQALGTVDVLELTRDRLLRLVEAVQETAFLAVVERDEVVYALQEEGPSALTMTARPGSRRPVHATALGKAHLAALPPREREEAIASLELRPATPSTITDPGLLRAELDATATRGYAIDNGELEPDVRCIAAAVRDHTGRPVAAVSVGGPEGRIRAKHDVIVALVTEAAAAVSDDLGCP